MKTTVLIVMMFVAAAVGAQNCPKGFSTSGACGVSLVGFVNAGQPFVAVHSPTVAMSGTAVNLIPAGSTHFGSALNYQTPVNVQAFSTTFTFVPNGWNIAFVLQNNTNVAASDGLNGLFAAGAGCEAGFYQGFTTNNLSTNNIFALAFSSTDSLQAGASNFTGSGVQVFSAGQSPCNPNLGGGVPYVGQDKFSTSPVPLTLSTGSADQCDFQNGCRTTTGDTYSATVTYDGSNVTLTLSDVTHPNGTFTHVWTGVNIPSEVGANTAYVGLTGGTNNTSTSPLLINSFVYTAGSVTPPPVAPANPTFSPAAGTYTSAQTVTIADATSGAAIYYTTDGSVPTTSSTRYTGPITVGASTTLSAAAFVTGAHSGTTTAVYTINLPPPPVTLAIPAQSIPLSITTAGTPITGTITIPAQTVTLP